MISYVYQISTGYESTSDFIIQGQCTHTFQLIL